VFSENIQKKLSAQGGVCSPERKPEETVPPSVSPGKVHRLSKSTAVPSETPDGDSTPESVAESLLSGDPRSSRLPHLPERGLDRPL
jgi:hypothetical protein